MESIKSLCKRAIWLEKGMISADEDVETCINSYLNANQGYIGNDENSNLSFIIEKVVLCDGNGNPKLNFSYGENISIKIYYYSKYRLQKPYFFIGIGEKNESIIGANMLIDGVRPKFIEGRGIIACTFKSVPLLPHMYSVSLGARLEDGLTPLIKTSEIAFFSINGDVKKLGFTGELAETMLMVSAPVFVPYEWNLPDEGIIKVDINEEVLSDETINF
jgi:hypothetical protein